MTEWWRSMRATLRLLGRVPLVLRAVVLASCVVAIAATIAPSWDVPNGYLYIAAIAAVVATVVPDAGGGFFFAGAIVVAWATGADTPDAGPAVTVTALALLAGHVAGALAAAMPPTAAADLTLTLRWWRPTAVIAAGTVATAVLVAGTRRLEPARLDRRRARRPRRRRRRRLEVVGRRRGVETSAVRRRRDIRRISATAPRPCRAARTAARRSGRSR